MTEKKNLKPEWDRAQIKHIIAPAWSGTRRNEKITDVFNALSRGELTMVAEALWDDVVELNEVMLDKKAVAECAGMSISWLDNSDCDKAKKLRAVGVRYGKAQTSPVRFQRSKVQHICREDEATFP